MQVKFQVAQPFDFTKYSYVVVFNTSGNLITPVASATQNGYAGFYFAIAVSGGGSPTATAWFYDRSGGVTQPFLRSIPFVQQDLQLVSVNSNGTNTQFTILFRRNLAYSFATPSPSVNSANWNFNYFVTAGQFGPGSSTVVDSLGHSPSGATDTTYASPTLNTATAFDTGNFQPLVGPPPADQSSQIVSGDIQNNP